MTLTPAQIELLLALIEGAIKVGEEVYSAAQLKELSALQTAVAAQRAQTDQDRAEVTANVAARDAAFEQELASAEAAKKSGS